jgi:hypothetical protein
MADTTAPMTDYLECSCDEKHRPHLHTPGGTYTLTSTERHALSASRQLGAAGVTVADEDRRRLTRAFEMLVDLTTANDTVRAAMLATFGHAITGGPIPS